MENYKKCPLKKRPIIYDVVEDIQQPENLCTKPEDLSVKNITNKSQIENFALNLSSTSVYDQLLGTNMNPVNWYSRPTKLDVPREGSLSPLSTSSGCSRDFVRESSISPPALNNYTNIHLRGLNPVNPVARTNSSYRQKRFVPYSMKVENRVPVIYSPDMMPPTTTTWNNQLYSTQEPEDLSVRSYVPEPVMNKNYQQENKYHINEKPKTLSRYKCNDCGKSYSTFAGLSKHQQFHCPSAECNQVKKDFKCKSCDKVYNSLGALKMHIRTHTLPCKCTICGKAFSRPWLLQGHIRTHTGEKPFNCQYCHRAFADRSNLRAHLQTHADVKKYQCTVCNKSFSRMSLLNKHNDGGCSISGGHIIIDGN